MTIIAHRMLGAVMSWLLLAASATATDFPVTIYVLGPVPPVLTTTCRVSATHIFTAPGMQWSAPFTVAGGGVATCPPCYDIAPCLRKH